MSKRLRRFFTENLGFKVLSLLVAVTLWVLVSMGQTESELPKRVSVEIKNMPPNLIRSSDLPNELEIKVSGRMSLLRSIRDNELRYVIDLTGARAGSSNHRVYAPRIEGLAEGVRVTEISPSQFDLKLSGRKKRTVRINPVLYGKPAEGLEVLGRTVVPEFVEVTGAEEEVDILTMVDTQIIDLTGRGETFSIKVGLDLVGRHVELVANQEVQVNVYIGSPKVTRMFQGVRIVVRGTSYRYQLSRERLDVQLEGSQDQLTRLTPEDPVLALDASNLEPGTYAADLTLELPEGINLRYSDLPQVQITILPEKQKTPTKKKIVDTP